MRWLKRFLSGLYLNSPDHAVVLSGGEKSQCQALERSQPTLPMGLGYVEGLPTIVYGTEPRRSLALDIANGTVRAACKDRHRHQEVLSFPRTVDESVPKELDVHLILDNYATHQYEKIK